MTHPLQLPAQLLSGPSLTTTQTAFTLLQKALCPHNGCTTCLDCLNIVQKTHQFLLWITPEKRYTLETIAPIFEKAQFALDAQEQFFFIIEKADLLTTACANSMLKLIEEPPHGYRFIFLTERPSQVLITIRSRCIQTTLSTPQEVPVLPPLIQKFLSVDSGDPVTLTKEITYTTLTELECMGHVDDLLVHAIKNYKRALVDGNKETQKSSLAAIELLKNALTHPPQPGSSKLFLKNLFLQKDGS